MESLSGTLFTDRAAHVRERLFDLPEPKGGSLSQFNRTKTLNALSERLRRIADHYGG